MDPGLIPVDLTADDDNDNEVSNTMTDAAGKYRIAEPRPRNRWMHSAAAQSRWTDQDVAQSQHLSPIASNSTDSALPEGESDGGAVNDQNNVRGHAKPVFGTKGPVCVRRDKERLLPTAASSTVFRDTARAYGRRAAQPKAQTKDGNRGGVVGHRANQYNRALLSTPGSNTTTVGVMGGEAAPLRNHLNDLDPWVAGLAGTSDAGTGLRTKRPASPTGETSRKKVRRARPPVVKDKDGEGNQFPYIFGKGTPVDTDYKMLVEAYKLSRFALLRRQTGSLNNLRAITKDELEGMANSFLNALSRAGFPKNPSDKVEAMNKAIEQHNAMFAGWTFCEGAPLVPRGKTVEGKRLTKAYGFQTR